MFDAYHQLLAIAWSDIIRTVGSSLAGVAAFVCTRQHADDADKQVAVVASRKSVALGS